MSQPNPSARPTLGGHETFTFRYGWLRKGVELANENGNIFSQDDALVQLGVGKNMVRAIRHWCLATNLLEESQSEGRTKPLQPTNLAKKLLLQTNAWDAYLEESASLWLLHWELISNPYRAWAWGQLFTAFLDTEFTFADFETKLARQAERLGISTTSKTFTREIECCLKTYIPANQRNRRKTETYTEESIDCPLTELDLLHYTATDRYYRFQIGPKPSLSAPVFGYALLKFWAQRANNRRTLRVDKCIYEPGSPGQAFKLDENSVMAYLEELENLSHNRLMLTKTAGLRQIALPDDNLQNLSAIAWELLPLAYVH